MAPKGNVGTLGPNPLLGTFGFLIFNAQGMILWANFKKTRA